MTWRERVNEALRSGNARNTSYTRADSDAFVPIVPSVPASPSRVLRHWHSKLSTLDVHQPPKGYAAKDWAQLVDDAVWLYENHAAYAVRNGWTAQSLFGVRLGHASSGGVAQLLQSCRSVVFDGPRAFIRSYGVTLKRNVHCGDGLPLIWEIS